MVKNKIGGNKSKNISSKVTKKKISAEDPDFENSFFGVITVKPNGLMCKVKIIMNDKIKSILEEHGIEDTIQANIGKLKHDKRNNSLAPDDIVQVEINFDMKRQNGNVYAYILCKYDASEIKAFKKAGLLQLDNDEKEEDMMPPESSDSDEMPEMSLDDL